MGSLHFVRDFCKHSYFSKPVRNANYTSNPTLVTPTTNTKAHHLQFQHSILVVRSGVHKVKIGEISLIRT